MSGLLEEYRELHTGHQDVARLRAQPLANSLGPDREEASDTTFQAHAVHILKGPPNGGRSKSCHGSSNDPIHVPWKHRRFNSASFLTLLPKYSLALA